MGFSGVLGIPERKGYCMPREIVAGVAIERPTGRGGSEYIGEPIVPDVGDLVAVWRHVAIGYSGTTETWSIDHRDVALDGPMGQWTDNDVTRRWFGHGHGIVKGALPDDRWLVEIWW